MAQNGMLQDCLAVHISAMMQLDSTVRELLRAFSALWSDVYARVTPRMSAASVNTLGGAVFTDATWWMCFLVSFILCLMSLPSSASCCCGIGFRLRTTGMLSVVQMLRQGRGWMRCLLFPIVFLVMERLFRLFDTCLVCVQRLCRIHPLFVGARSLSVQGMLCGLG